MRYRATIADKSAWRRDQCPKPFQLSKNLMLRNLVYAKLCEGWSPEQNAGWLKLTYPNEERMRVSHETIYKSLFVQTRGLLRKELRNHLRSKRNFRHAKDHKPGLGQQILDGVSIRERLPTSKTVQFWGIGKVILSAFQRTATLPLLLIGRPALRFWLKSRTKRQTVWSQPWRVIWLNCRSG